MFNHFGGLIVRLMPIIKPFAGISGSGESEWREAVELAKCSPHLFRHPVACVRQSMVENWTAFAEMNATYQDAMDNGRMDDRDMEMLVFLCAEDEEQMHLIAQNVKPKWIV